VPQSHAGLLIKKKAESSGPLYVSADTARERDSRKVRKSLLDLKPTIPHIGYLIIIEFLIVHLEALSDHQKPVIRGMVLSDGVRDSFQVCGLLF
jgi:hypothetical protein